MFNKMYFSITTMASLVIIVLICAFAVTAVTAPTLPPKQAVTVEKPVTVAAAEIPVTTITAETPVAASTLNLSATTLNQTPSTEIGLGMNQNPNLTFDLVPQNLTVAVGDTFVVTVAVENVTDMYGWQVYLCFNQTVVECTGVSLPSNSGFSNSTTVSDILKNYNATEFPHGPVQRIRNDVGWVLAGDCLLGENQTTFNGSCLLCQIEFRAVSPGSTALELFHDFVHTFQTYIITSNLADITSESTSCSYIHVASN